MGGCRLGKGMKEQAGVLGMFCILVWTVGTWVCIPIKSHQAIHSRCVLLLWSMLFMPASKRIKTWMALSSSSFDTHSSQEKEKVNELKEIRNKEKVNELELKRIYKIHHTEAETAKWQTLRNIEARVRSMQSPRRYNGQAISKKGTNSLVLNVQWTPCKTNKRNSYPNT